jgi:hypothetical protein
MDDYHRAARVDGGDHDIGQMGQQFGELNTTYRQDRRKAVFASIPRSSDLPLRKSCQSHVDPYTDTNHRFLEGLAQHTVSVDA